jgi:hypothetical protein
MTFESGGSYPHITKSKTVLVRTSIPVEISNALDHLGVDLGTSKQELISRGISLLLRYYGRDSGLPLVGLTCPVTTETEVLK